MTIETIDPGLARRAALSAQGFADTRPSGPITRRHLARTLDRIRLLQLDSVNVAVRAHYMPLFSRLGPYERALVDDAAWAHSARRPRLLVEDWAHEASLLPVQDWPLMRARVQVGRYWQRYASIVDQHPKLVDDVLAAVRELAPVSAGELQAAIGGQGRPRSVGASWWERSDVKRICEYLFGVGELTTATRRHFERLYDLPERVLPPHVFAARPPSRDEAARTLIARAASALGVATEPDLRDYYRIGPAYSRRAPFLLDGDLVARLDVKADRAAGVLRVLSAFAELGVDVARVTSELAAELREMATWLGLNGVVVGERGDLVTSLAAATR